MPERRSLFRLVETDPPTRDDFLSYVDLGFAPLRASARSLHHLRGVSMFETEEQAREAAATMTKRDDFIAQVRLPDIAVAERQGRRPGHHNVYASPDDLLRCVVRVVPVGLASGREGR